MLAVVERRISFEAFVDGLDGWEREVLVLSGWGRGYLLA